MRWRGMALNYERVTMNDREQRAAAKKFAAEWSGRGDEKSDTQPFWMSLLSRVFGVEAPETFIEFEKTVKVDGSTKFIDAYIPSTKVLIEQKSADVKLDKAYTQSGGAELTPYQQAKRYDDNLPFDERARYIVVSNFASFLVFDMNRPGQPPEEIPLADLPRECHRLRFLADDSQARIQKELELSIEAGDIVRDIYDRLLPKYLHPESPATLKSLNILCVRLVFCLYAEDAGLFGSRSQFHDYLKRFEPRDVRRALIDLFKTLDTPSDKRDPYLDTDLAAFPYVNGGLFADENVEIPPFDEELKAILLARASDGFDWSAISPTIFGAVFESTLNPETRRTGGMHYTSIQNIHKVIDPLFLDALKAELAAIKSEAVAPTRAKRLLAFRKKLASLTFLDPACGSGNFLTETYLSLRRLENEAIETAADGQLLLDFGNDLIQVSISQFYGIEINDFAVAVARTALWIAESQMFMETETILHSTMEFLPLKSYSGIVEGNALTVDWGGVKREVRGEGLGISKDSHASNSPLATSHYSYIMGNPPFIGYSLQSKEQKEEMLSIYIDEKGKAYKTAGKLDYVAGWYFKAAQMMAGTDTRAAFVSTNSITQGEQVAGVWRPLIERFGLEIDFAHRTFKWQNESKGCAAVHCVIVGFHAMGCTNDGGLRPPNPLLPPTPPLVGGGFGGHRPPSLVATSKTIFDGTMAIPAHHINGYLMDAPDIFIASRPKPLCDVPEMTTGNRPADGGNLIIEESDYAAFVKAEPAAQKYIKRLVGSEEFINNRKRWCLWLVGVSPSELRSMPLVMKRIQACKEDRENSPDAGRRKLAQTPWLFREQLNPEKFIVVPLVSSARRTYVPLGYLDGDTICTNLVTIIPNATLYHFGVLISIVHNAWMRVVCGRLKSDYRYSKDIVYNNFPWPECGGTCSVPGTLVPGVVAAIEATAQGILDARARYPDSSLADLYDERTMPADLRRAHHLNDHAVMAAYGYSKEMSEADIVADLFRRYERLVRR